MAASSASFLDPARDLGLARLSSGTPPTSRPATWLSSRSTPSTCRRPTGAATSGSRATPGGSRRRSRATRGSPRGTRAAKRGPLRRGQSARGITPLQQPMGSRATARWAEPPRGSGGRPPLADSLPAFPLSVPSHSEGEGKGRQPLTRCSHPWAAALLRSLPF